jgi:hypothetical protein
MIYGDLVGQIFFYVTVDGMSYHAKISPNWFCKWYSKVKDELLQLVKGSSMIFSNTACFLAVMNSNKRKEEGPLLRSHSEYKYLSFNVLVHWENSYETFEPLYVWSSFIGKEKLFTTGSHSWFESTHAPPVPAVQFHTTHLTHGTATTPPFGGANLTSVNIRHFVLVDAHDSSFQQHHLLIHQPPHLLFSCGHTNKLSTCNVQYNLLQHVSSVSGGTTKDSGYQGYW